MCVGTAVSMDTYSTSFPLAINSFNSTPSSRAAVRRTSPVCTEKHRSRSPRSKDASHERSTSNKTAPKGPSPVKPNSSPVALPVFLSRACLLYSTYFARHQTFFDPIWTKARKTSVRRDMRKGAATSFADQIRPDQIYVTSLSLISV